MQSNLENKKKTTYFLWTISEKKGHSVNSEVAHFLSIVYWHEFCERLDVKAPTRKDYSDLV